MRKESDIHTCIFMGTMLYSLNNRAPLEFRQNKPFTTLRQLGGGGS